MEVKNYGFIEPTIEPDQYIYGAQLGAKTKTLVENGQWHEFVPEFEPQSNLFLETFNCTNYGTQTAIQMLMKRVFGIDFNGSERHTGVETGTTPAGNNPHKVIEIIRKDCGLIPDEMLPFDESIKTWDEYYSPKPMSKEFKKEGLKFLENYTINHDWVYVNAPKENRAQLLMQALKSSPVCVDVDAWHEDENGIHFRVNRSNHWCTLYGYVEGEYWLVFDSYKGETGGHKKLAWDYEFYYPKRYSIERNIGKTNWLNDLFKKLFSWLF